MASSVQARPVVLPAAAVPATQQPARRKLPIVPAIPRRLEKHFGRSSSLAAGSRSVTNTAFDPPTSRPMDRLDETSHLDHRPDRDIHQDTQVTHEVHESMEVAANGQSSIDGVHGTETATAEGVTPAALTPPAATLPPPSILNPESPPFVPEVSETPTETLDGASSLDGNLSDPRAPLPHQTTDTKWNPYQTMPTDQGIQSPIQQPYATYGPRNALFYPPTVFHNDKYSSQPIYYGYDPSRPVSFDRQSSQLYVSASPVQSSYEGYTMANPPHPELSQNIPSSHPPAISTVGKLQGHPVYTTSQHQSQHSQPLPQFGSHFPITPSATPSNSGSLKQGPPSTHDADQVSAVDQPLKDESNHKVTTVGKISRDYRNWCDQTIETLEEGPEQLALSSTLLNHLIQNFNTPTLADCELYISHVSHRFEPAVVSLHSLLIAQNPKLHALLQGAEVREDGKRQMLLNVKDQYANPAAVKSAIKICYGDRPSQYTGYPGELASELQVSLAWMNNALAFAAAGHLLAMTGVAHRGEQIASMVLNWDNLERALAFAMDTKIQRAWGSSTSRSSFPCNASELLLSCLYFVISNISESVQLDLTVESLSSINPLPIVALSDLPSTKSRLSRIQFGDLPLEVEEPISKQDSLTSTILFSLPFDHVKFILDRVPLDVNTKITKSVVQERERRRLRALNDIISTSPADEQLHTSLTQEERIHDKGGRLTLVTS
ncbi:MAG: hypothetical protein L6R40_000749 [Gallowayella cf. fulva]|nr:MAG: hypothetical protein L6R40_000749 [Xanthomendoza cf. fulva]